MLKRRQRTRSGATRLEGQPVGAALVIVGVDGERDRTMRLLQLGLRVGETVVVTHTRGRGVVVASAAGRIAVGPELARHVRVDCLDPAAVDGARGARARIGQVPQ